MCAKTSLSDKKMIKSSGAAQLLSNKDKVAFVKTLYREPSPQEQKELDEILSKIKDQ